MLRSDHNAMTVSRGSMTCWAVTSRSRSERTMILLISASLGCAWRAAAQDVLQLFREKA